MPLTQELIEQLTPETPAPGEFEIEKTLRIKDAGRRRRLAWTQYLRSEEFYYKYIIENIPENIRPWHLGVGLIPTIGFATDGPEYMIDAIKDSSYTWGIVLSVDAFADAVVIQSKLDFDRRQFPIIVSPTQIEMQSLCLSGSQNAPTGSRATWASAKATAQSPASAEGLLTARHVPDRCGQSSLWSTETNSWFDVYRRGSTYVDASYLEGSWGGINPSKTLPRSVNQIGSGDQITLDGAYSTLNGFVTHEPHPNYIGGGSPSHVFLSVWGVNGDSGGLVHDQGLPISMFLGKTTNKDKSEEGLSISLEQVVSDLEIDLLT